MKLIVVTRLFSLSSFVQLTGDRILACLFDSTTAVDLWSIGCVLAEMLRGSLQLLCSCVTL